MKSLQFFTLTMLLGFFLFQGCGEDDLEAILASDISITIEEDKATGFSLAFINATSSEGVISYSIVTQEPANAISLNTISGEITVNDPSAFDYELNNTVNAVIAITDGINLKHISVVITISNISEIEQLLTTSLIPYQNAADNIWVEITESEYTLLSNGIAAVTKSGCSDAELNFAASITQSSANNAIANNNGHTIPSASYLFGFMYYSLGSATTNDKVIVSDTDIQGPYRYVGSNLPTVADGAHYFILKGSNEFTAGIGYLGIYLHSSIGYKNVPSANQYYWVVGDETNLTSSGAGATFLYQGLSTTVKQWD